MTPSQVLAQRVRWFRSERGWSQQELMRRLSKAGADRIEQRHPFDTGSVRHTKGVLSGIPDQSALSRIESGKRVVSLDEFIALAIALECTPADLLTPLDVDQSVEATPTTVLSWPRFRQWFRAERPAGPDARLSFLHDRVTLDEALGDAEQFPDDEDYLAEIAWNDRVGQAETKRRRAKGPTNQKGDR